MQDSNIIPDIDKIVGWLPAHTSMLIDYGVQIIIAIIILILGNIIAKIVSRSVIKVMELRQIDKTVTYFISSLLRYVVLVISIVAALGHLGVQTTSIIAVIGAAGLAIGLALQGSLSNFAAGVILIIFRPFKAGEYIDFGGSDAGTVRSVQIFSTTIYTPDGMLIIIPNSKIISGNIKNYSREPNRRLDLIIGVDYNADIDKVKMILNSIVDKDERIINELGRVIRLKQLGDSSLNFLVRVWTKNGDYWPVNYDLLENIKRALDENDINIPFPVMDVNLRQIK